MNPLTLLLHVWLVLAAPPALNQVETILAVDTSEAINTQVLDTLRDQLQDRLDRSDFQPATVEISDVSGQLVVTATVDAEDEQAMAAYRNLFTSTTLGLWNTYHLHDAEIEEWMQDLGPIEGFDFNAVEISDTKLFGQPVALQRNGGREVHTAALGVCSREADQQRILDHLRTTTDGLPDLQLRWSPLTVDRYTGEAYYRLFMIKTDGREDAPLTEAHLTRVEAYQERWTN
ncbi:MAG: hypothetical protein KDC54_19555, partial [Lewinella sp.]|nr:hypothetical protein [Lewinella sp.]